MALDLLPNLQLFANLFFYVLLLFLSDFRYRSRAAEKVGQLSLSLSLSPSGQLFDE